MGLKILAWLSFTQIMAFYFNKPPIGVLIVTIFTFSVPSAVKSFFVHPTNKKMRQILIELDTQLISKFRDRRLRAFELIIANELLQLF